ncbi:hypothetical protein DI09_272p10 [Mitosporidium daphniae]|uniref:Uncharacterized protein n=1 Tax=Mitosporidium daphniae TaxID=1485682 RepID=A0A098VVP3_9MICR|nr:uncharacterized protein DI09_272p10 [Mitosporidium daphniae]KGG51796.1 hypothetical protein DI09_272p10 [Mitosporidium daphniae]|eukprot:XP_013238232.1 uncharacterized protein DI09_272p10 [Mitosporidium daphniae]
MTLIATENSQNLLVSHVNGIEKDLLNLKILTDQKAQETQEAQGMLLEILSIPYLFNLKNLILKDFIAAQKNLVDQEVLAEEQALKIIKVLQVQISQEDMQTLENRKAPKEDLPAQKAEEARLLQKDQSS